MSLQDDFDLLQPNEILSLTQGEYQGPLKIDKPCKIVGKNSVIWAQKGPILEIISKGVTLKDLQLEITGSENFLDFVALKISNDSLPKIENVVIIGKVIGLPKEEDTWDYPKSFNLGSLQPNQKYEKGFRIISPIACKIKSDISSIAINKDSIERGFNDIILLIDPLPPDTIITGKIFLISQFIRIINIYGAATDKLAIPDNREKSPTWIQLIEGQRYEYKNPSNKEIIGVGWHSTEFIKYRIKVSGVSINNNSNKLEDVDLSQLLKSGFIKLNDPKNVDKLELIFQLSDIEKTCEKVKVTIIVDPIVGGINNFTHMDKLYIRGISSDTNKEDFFYPIDQFSPLDNAITLFEIYQHKNNWKIHPIGRSFRE